MRSSISVTMKMTLISLSIDCVNLTNNMEYALQAKFDSNSKPGTYLVSKRLWNTIIVAMHLLTRPLIYSCHKHTINKYNHIYLHTNTDY